MGEMPPASTVSAGCERLRAQRSCAKSIFLFGRDRSSRPGRAVLREHGAHGRVKAGRRAAARRALDASRPRLDRPSTVLPCGEAGSIPCIALLGHPTGRLPSTGGAAGDTLSPGNALRGSGRHPHGRKPRQRVPSRGRLRPRDSTRPEPEGRGGRPNTGRKDHKSNVILFPDGPRPTPRRSSSAIRRPRSILQHGRQTKIRTAWVRSVRAVTAPHSRVVSSWADRPPGPRVAGW